MRRLNIPLCDHGGYRVPADKMYPPHLCVAESLAFSDAFVEEIEGEILIV